VAGLRAMGNACLFIPPLETLRTEGPPWQTATPARPPACPWPAKRAKPKPCVPRQPRAAMPSRCVTPAV